MARARCAVGETLKVREQERAVQKLIAGLCLSWLIAASPAHAEPPQVVAMVDSPGKVLHVELSLDEGRIAYSISRLGVPVIAPSRLGFLLRNTEKLERNFALATQSTRSVDETWEQPWGETRTVRNHYSELSARFTEQVKL
ncbi:MAG: glycoside hydrolase family 97 N-terminal domain-containing protein, partial [Xanthomonadales bacterium]|nr:glycoside hydrolase family 97 N-terminal domain-containing protein [Xanthomonadales bacterium]